ncbi:uncharacterized protein LOC108442824 [Pygocentrus nattereri]|uniref:uncharacterized protein LOC108442824 n=1 Tax=Pygocentrus nattereri TaxID=42514 RepID=UPI0008145EE1|nr:uncharacterized protein LOC108442824 [Pygocentrus nattereri]
MLPGHHLRLALVSLFFLLGKCNAAPPLIARSIKYTTEGKNLTEELKNVENFHNVYPSSHHYSVPVNTDVNSSERSTPKALSANSSTVSIWNNNTFNGYITSHVYSTSSNGRVLSLVSPYPDSSGMLPSRSANRMNFVSVNSNYKTHRLSPVDTGRIEGPYNLNQHQYKGHVTDGTPLHHHQTDDQRGGRTRDLFKRTIKINENISIVRGIGQHIIPTQNVSSSELKLVLSNSSEHLNIMNLSSKFVRQHHLQMAQRPYIQESWKPYTDPVQAIKGPQSVSFRSKPGEQTSSERDTTRSGDQTVNYKATNIIRVKTSHAFKGYHSPGTTKTNSQDHIQDISRSRQLGPFATHLPTPNSVTSNGLFSSQRLPSPGINRVQAQHSQRKPSATIYATPAPQLVWRSPYRLKSEGDDAKFDSPPMTLSPSNYISHPSFRRFGGLHTISATSRTGTVQWLVIKPKPASNSARDTVHHRAHLSTDIHKISAKQSVSKSIPENQSQPHYTGLKNAHAARDFTMSSKDLYHPQTLHDQQAWEYGEPKDKMALIGIHAGQDQSERSHGWTANANVSVSNTEVPSIGRLAERVYDFDHSKSTMKNYLSIKSSQISKTIASDAGKTPSQDLSAASKGDARYESTSMYSQVNASPNRDATGGDQAVDGLWNHYSQFGSIQNHLSNVFASDTEMQYSKPAQTRMFSSKVSPESVLTIKGAYSSDGNIHSAHESTSHSGTLSHSFRPQNATEDKGSDSFLEFFPASPEPVTPQNEIRHIQEKINNIQRAPNELFNSSQDEVKAAEEHQMENVKHAKTVQQYSSLFNIKHSSSPTSSVVILKRIKVHPTDKRKDPETQYRSENARSPALIYRSPIIRKKSKSKPLNGLVDPSEDFTTSENHGRLNQNIEIGAQTENLPAKFEVEPSYATGILRNVNVPAQTTGTIQHFSSPLRRLNQNLKSIQFLDVAGSATFSVYGPSIKGNPR